MSSVGRVVPSKGPIVQLSVQRPGNREREIETLLDTGFNGFLALPSSLIEEFSLPHLGREQVTLATGKVHFIRNPTVNGGSNVREDGVSCHSKPSLAPGIPTS